MQRRHVGCLALTAWLATAAVGQRDRIERAVREAESRGVRTGVAICDDDGDVLFRHRAAEAFAPASNMKLLTAAALLQGLGKDFTFQTVFRVAEGELVVEASGDPNWIRGSAHDPDKLFGRVVAALRERGVRSLRGVRLDAGAFTGPGRPSTWPQNQLYTYYCAPTGGFVLEQGTFLTRIARSGGSAANVRLLAPATGYEIQGSIREVSSRKGATYGAIDQDGAVRVRGKFYRKSPPVEIRTAVNHPERWYEDALQHALRGGGVRVARGAAAHAGGVVYRHASSLRPALRRILEDSSNFDAEQCLRVLGARTQRDGSLAGARKALREQVVALVGQEPVGLEVFDGSGLSKENRLTPGLLVVAMFELERRGLGDALRDALPVAGRTGTLRSRFRGTDLVDRVRAKTGWIRGASSLSGVVTCADGERRWFSILMNYDRSRGGLNKDLKKLQEQIVAAAAGVRAE